MAINVDQVKKLLGNGLSAEVVASAVGCSPSYISQLLSDSSFAFTVSEQRIATLQDTVTRDGKLNSIEDKLLEKLENAVDNDAFYRPKDLLYAMTAVNRAVRRSAPSLLSSSQNNLTINTIVSLSLPTKVVRKFTTNRVNEVVEVEGQTLVTMNASQLLTSLASGDLQDSREVVEGSLVEEEVARACEGPDSDTTENNSTSTYNNQTYQQLKTQVQERQENERLSTSANQRDFSHRRSKYLDALKYLPSGVETKVVGGT